MITTLVILFTLLMVASQALHIFSLPANWVLIGLAVLLDVLLDVPGMDTAFFLWLIGLGVVGEVLEFAGQFYGGKRYGASNRGNLGGLVGAFVGAILGAPFLFGLGALPGALLGGWLGGFFTEISAGRPRGEAVKAAWGGFWGRLFGMAVKAGLGVAMLVLTLPRVWSLL